MLGEQDVESKSAGQAPVEHRVIRRLEKGSPSAPKLLRVCSRGPTHEDDGENKGSHHRPRSELPALDRDHALGGRPGS
jgi:hypothetical protein